MKKEIVTWVIVFISVTVLALLAHRFVILNVEVVGGSMQNTIQPNSRLIGLRLTYTFSDPERFDVVVIENRFTSATDSRLIKRIIGLPGELLEIRDGEVFIDEADEPLYEWYLRETPNKDGDFSFSIPDGFYFVMGDNRNYSDDSRTWGSVGRGDLLGKVYFMYIPTFAIIE